MSLPTRFPVLAASLVLLVAACGPSADAPLDCDSAAKILASCTDSSPPDRCGDDSPAAQLFASGQCSELGGKADGFGIFNREQGEACSWRWQCDLDSGLTCNGGVCDHVDIEGACALPTPDYLALSAEQKLDRLFALHQASPTVPVNDFENAAVALEAVTQFLVDPRGAEEIVRTFTRNCDVFAEPRVKQVHALGTVARGRFVINSGSPYTGLLAPGQVPLLIRFSIANPVLGVSLPDILPKPEFIPGIGIKLFVDGRPSQNIVAMDSLAGQGNDHNYFLHNFSNNFSAHAPDTDDPVYKSLYAADPANHTIMSLVGVRFREALKLVRGSAGAVPFHRPIAGLAGVRVDGSDVPEPVAPDWLVFVPDADVYAKKEVVSSDPSIDFRDKLSHLAPGDHVFQIYAVKDGQQTLIGYLVVDSTPRPSYWGDRQLFIQHPL